MGEPGKEDADLDRVGQAEIEGRAGTSDAAGRPDMPPAGPHAKPSLTSPEATPGAGSLPSSSPDDEADAATG